jgi:hypothetical protein
MQLAPPATDKGFRSFSTWVVPEMMDVTAMRKMIRVFFSYR